MNMMDIAFPIVVALILLELFLGKLSRKPAYRINDTLAGMSTGIMFLLVGVPTLFLALIVYDYIEHHYSIFRLIGVGPIPFENPLSFISHFPFVQINAVPFLYWTVSLIVVDLAYYWFHRLSHEINFLWGSHVTHHSTEQFNLGISFRGGMLQRVFEYSFYMPLAFLGINWIVFLFAHRVLKLYQFWVHAANIPKLHPFIEAVFVTPWNHRVHHGRNPQYIDKNHGGIFIVWDRLFGTFEPTVEKVNLGITEQLNSFNPLWMTFHYYAKLLKMSIKTRSWKDKIKVWFASPGWRPADLGPSEVVEADPDRPDFDPYITGFAKYYAIAQFFILSAAGILAYSLAHDSAFGIIRLLILTSLTIYGLTVVGGILQNSSWVIKAETVRLTLTGVAVAGIYFLNQMTFEAWALITAYCGISAGIFYSYLDRFRVHPQNQQFEHESGFTDRSASLVA